MSLSKETIFLRLLNDDDKQAVLLTAVEAVCAGDSLSGIVYTVDPESFQQVPGSPFAYWVSERVRKLFNELPPFESEGRAVKQGLATADDFRFVRAWWEVAPAKILTGTVETTPEEFRRQTFYGKKWAFFAKGGPYSPYYADLHLVVNWERDGSEIRSFVDPDTNRTFSRPQNIDFYFRPGLTWSYRTHRLCLQELPKGVVISVRGSGLYADLKTLHIWLGLGNSRLLDFLVKVTLGREDHPQFDQGDLKLMPFPKFDASSSEELSRLALEGLQNEKQIASSREESLTFTIPALLQMCGSTLADSSSAWQMHIDAAAYKRAENERRIDRIAQRLYAVDSESEMKQIGSGSSPVCLSDSPDADADGYAAGESSISEVQVHTADVISYMLGCVFGRWDVRLATGEREAPPLLDPFAPLPACSPGMLTGEDGMPARKTPPNYPLRIDWDGILVDDPDHDDDIVKCVRDLFILIWKDRAEAIERETCEIFGVGDLRDYFRKPTAGGFWSSHISRYSKSGRKAPIYWLLQSSRKNYALWLYYPRLDRDLIHKARLNYVEPKLRLEENRLAQLKADRANAGVAGREAKQIEKQLERQEALLTELHDFHDKLKRAAELNLTPDLDDGVVLNIAPLWELVPWAEAKKYWQELMAGKYEWSSIGKQLRERGLVRE